VSLVKAVVMLNLMLLDLMLLNLMLIQVKLIVMLLSTRMKTKVNMAPGHDRWKRYCCCYP
jgi:hypothetical protein